MRDPLFSNVGFGLKSLLSRSNHFLEEVYSPVQPKTHDVSSFYTSFNTYVLGLTANRHPAVDLLEILVA